MNYKYFKANNDTLRLFFQKTIKQPTTLPIFFTSSIRT